jgi:hypothetical protein
VVSAADPLQPYSRISRALKNSMAKKTKNYYYYYLIEPQIDFHPVAVVLQYDTTHENTRQTK